MYIDYSNLWKLLAQKGISKSDLMQLTGLSSRIIAKLTKNETVTTDTVARICTALSCDVGDIMQCSNESSYSVYDAFRFVGKVAEENDNYKKTVFEKNGQRYSVYVSKKSANKATRIYCEADGSVYWEQSYMMGGICTPLLERTFLVKPERSNGEIAIVVIKGKPGVMIGLDEGIWVSAKNGNLKGERDIFMMSEAVFKVFSPLR
jgi:DNA-binding Xre family transcriptional regulator